MRICWCWYVTANLHSFVSGDIMAQQMDGMNQTLCGYSFCFLGEVLLIAEADRIHSGSCKNRCQKWQLYPWRFGFVQGTICVKMSSMNTAWRQDQPGEMAKTISEMIHMHIHTLLNNWTNVLDRSQKLDYADYSFCWLRTSDWLDFLNYLICLILTAILTVLNQEERTDINVLIKHIFI